MPAGTLETLAINEISRLSARESQASVLAPGGDLFGDLCIYLCKGKRIPSALGCRRNSSRWQQLVPAKFPETPVSLERNTEVFRHPLL